MAPVCKICASHVEHSAVNHQRLRVEGPFATQAFADENLRALPEKLSDGSLLFLRYRTSKLFSVDIQIQIETTVKTSFQLRKQSIFVHAVRGKLVVSGSALAAFPAGTLALALACSSA